MQKVLNARRFSEIGKEDRNILLSLMHCEKIRRDYRCSFNEGLVMLAKLHRKYEGELEVAMAVLDVFELGEDDGEENGERARTKN